MTFTPTQLAECAKREIRQRKRVYPRFVEKRGMTQAEADQQIAMMEQIERDYREKAARDPAGDGRLL